ncbi:MAG: hypothetical protein AB1801_13940 [Chloroflexota bacterium]
MAKPNEPVLLTSQEVEIAQALARDLAPYVDRNEVGKVLDYFRRVRSTEKFFKLLDALPRSGYTRSKRTRDYLTQIRSACRQHLRPVTDDQHALAIVGWSFRLMTYYQTLKGQRSAQNR